MWLQTLNGKWSFRQAGSDEWLPATVPGGVHTDLVAVGRIPNPFALDNEQAVQWVAQADWEYGRAFTVDPPVFGQERIFLVCDGLDTLAEVRLNGAPLGSAANMFRQYRWDVTALLRPGENHLSILFRSPVQYVNALFDQQPLQGAIEWIKGGMYIRKAPCHFGWDWGPHMPAIGIWKDIYLEAGRGGRMEDVRVQQMHTARTVALNASVTAERWTDAPMQLVMRVTAPDGNEIEATAPVSGSTGRVSVSIERPQLWWPNDYGPQPLYQVEVTLFSGERLLDSKTLTVGLRTVELVRQPDEWGESFYFLVNGVPVFCKGSNWIPADSFPTRVTPARLKHLIASAAATHQNMLRVWGGGYYESDDFYNLCDQYGILVWQDFIFSCSVYPLDNPAMLENIHQEVLENVRRIRHHACLALWCGNNEMDMGWANWGWVLPGTLELRPDDEKFFHHTLPDWVAREDPDHAYWPSSPTSGTPPENPNNGRTGDIHQWEVWHALKPFSSYRQTHARFVSEFGFQSLPALATVATYAPPEEWNMTSYLMEYHQRNPRGNSIIVTYMTSHFRLPKDFDSLIYLTQLLQAEAVRIGVEHWRRERARTGGTLYWQLNDTWPVASWSSIDYYGRWKALQYLARRIYAPLLLSIEDRTARMDVFITSDLLLPQPCEVRWWLETVRGEPLRSGTQTVTATPLATTPVTGIDLREEALAPRRDVVLVCELWQEGELRQTQVIPLTPDKHLVLEDPRIQVDGRLDGSFIILRLRAASLARFVELSLPDEDLIFSDNYFHLPAGRPVTVVCPLPVGMSKEQFLNRLHLRTLRDSY